MKKCIEQGCQETAHGRGSRCVVHLDEHIKYQKKIYRQNKKQQMITIQCSGCPEIFETSKSIYESKKRYGQKNFYHTPECAVANRRAKEPYVDR